MMSEKDSTPSWVYFDRDVFAVWCEIGRHRCLASHSEIAAFLIESYKTKASTENRCACCSSPLPSFCSPCSMQQHQSRCCDQQQKKSPVGEPATSQPAVAQHMKPIADNCQGYCLSQQFKQEVFTEEEGSEYSNIRNLMKEVNQTLSEFNREDDFYVVPAFDGASCDPLEAEAAARLLKSSPSCALVKQQVDIQLAINSKSDAVRADANITEPLHLNEDSNYNDLADNDKVNETFDEEENMSDNSENSYDTNSTKKQQVSKPKKEEEKRHASQTKGWQYLLQQNRDPQTNLNLHQSQLTKNKIEYRNKDLEKIPGLVSKRSSYSPDPDKPFRCASCERSYSLEMHLKRHMTIAHQKIKPFSCHKCWKMFVTSSQLKKHGIVHSNRRPFLCNICEKTFKTAEVFKRHMKRYHDGSDFIQPPEHKKEIKIETKLRPFVCNVCQKTFKTAEAYKRHAKRHTEELDKNCIKTGDSDGDNNINSSFSQSANLASHSLRYLNTAAVQSADSKKPSSSTSCGPHQCKFCDRIFTTYTSMRRHVRTLHEKKRPFICDKCGKSFCSSQRVQQHYLVHTESRPYICETCGKAFKALTKLKVHEKTHKDIESTVTNKSHRKKATTKFKFNRLDDNSLITRGPLQSNPYQIALSGQFDNHEKMHSDSDQLQTVSNWNVSEKLSAVDLFKIVNEQSVEQNVIPSTPDQSKKGFSRRSLKKEEIQDWGKRAKKCTCHKCGKGFYTPYHLRNHMRTHTDIKPFKCDKCNKSFCLAQTLKDHGNVHSGLKPYKCSDCSKEFHYKSCLGTHQLRYHRGKRFKCDIEGCGASFAWERELKVHSMRHQNIRPYQCHLCIKAYFDVRGLRRHILAVHDKVKPFVCDKCGKSFPTARQLRIHSTVHTELRPFACEICSKTFKNTSHLSTHRLLHKRHEICVCELCGASLKSKKDFARHKMIHSDKLPYVCDQCPKGFIRLSNLRDHKLSRHPSVVRVKAFVCEICSKRFLTQRGLNGHMLIIHNNSNDELQTFFCDICNKEVKSNLSYQRHMQWHSFKKTVSCPRCSKVISASALRRHLMVHTGEKPYECDVCQAAFSNPATLRSHRFLHSNQRPFPCSMCNKAYTTNSKLNRHLRTHSGRRPLKCELCSKTFLWHRSYHIHLRNHWGGKTHECDVCGKNITSNYYKVKKQNDTLKGTQCIADTAVSFSITTTDSSHKDKVKVENSCEDCIEIKSN